MAYSINKVILVGNVGKDPETKTFQNGSKVVNFSIATSEKWKDKVSGENKEQTEWHRVTIFNAGLVSIAEQYIKKGMKVYIEGQLQTRKWQDQSGQDKYTTEVVLQNYKGDLVLLDRGSSDNMNNISEYSSEKLEKKESEEKKLTSGSDILDDEIPF